MLPNVSVVVTVKNEEEHIADLMDSIANLTYPKNKVETIIVDGGSTDKTTEIISKYPWARLIISKCNTSEGRNIGIKNASGKIIAFTDGDCIVKETWLKKIVKYFEEDPSIVGVGGPLCLLKQKEIMAQFLGAQSNVFLFPKKSGFVKSPIRLCSGNVAYRRKIFAEVGYFNEQMGLGSTLGSGEDVELNLRILNCGYKLLYAKDIRVYHKFRTSFKEGSKEVFKRGTASSKFYSTYDKVPTIKRFRNLLKPIIYLLSVFLFAVSILSRMWFLVYTMLILFFCYYLYKFTIFYTRNSHVNISPLIRIILPIIDMYMLFLFSLGSIFGLLGLIKKIGRGDAHVEY